MRNDPSLARPVALRQDVSVRLSAYMSSSIHPQIMLASVWSALVLILHRMKLDFLLTTSSVPRNAPVISRPCALYSRPIRHQDLGSCWGRLFPRGIIRCVSSVHELQQIGRPTIPIPGNVYLSHRQSDGRMGGWLAMSYMVVRLVDEGPVRPSSDGAGTAGILVQRMTGTCKRRENAWSGVPDGLLFTDRKSVV